MRLLGIDVGSSSVKSAVLRAGKVVGKITRSYFPTRHEGVRVEVKPESILKAVRDTVLDLGPAARRADAIALAVMSPAWIAMDAKGRPLTPVVTHQDRRSVEVALRVEERVGKDRHLSLAGNRPFPGSISSTTWAWYKAHEPQALKGVDLVGHLNTFLHRQFTGSRVIDPSNASFTGLYRTVEQSGWDEELCEAVGVRAPVLPEVLEADRIGGRLTREAARRLALPEGLPVTVGLVDTSAAMLLAGTEPGQLLNVCGSTDVLALCTDKPRPHERLLTRALGVGPRWMSVSTLAAAASAIYWAQRELFPDWPLKKFQKAVRDIGLRARGSGTDSDGPPVTFEPYLAGERASIEQRRGAFTGLTLATKRRDLLKAIVESLVAASAARLQLLDTGDVKIRRRVVVSGGALDRLDEIFHRDWPGRWTFHAEDEATLRGLGKLMPRES